MLVDHPDAARDAPRAGRRSSTSSPRTRIRPSVRRIQAVEDPHQRRFAGPVLTDQRVDLAGAQGQVDVVVGDDAGEALGDLSRERRAGRSARPAPSSVTVVLPCVLSPPALPDLDLAVDDLLLELVELSDDVLGQQVAVVALGVVDALLGHAEDLEPGSKLVQPRLRDHVVDGGVDPLQHRGQDVRLLLGARRQVLVRVDADRERTPARATADWNSPAPEAPGRVVHDVRSVVVELVGQRLRPWSGR